MAKSLFDRIAPQRLEPEIPRRLLDLGLYEKRRCLVEARDAISPVAHVIETTLEERLREKRLFLHQHSLPLDPEFDEAVVDLAYEIYYPIQDAYHEMQETISLFFDPLLCETFSWWHFLKKLNPLLHEERVFLTLQDMAHEDLQKLCDRAQLLHTINHQTLRRGVNTYLNYKLFITHEGNSPEEMGYFTALQNTFAAYAVIHNKLRSHKNKPWQENFID